LKEEIDLGNTDLEGQLNSLVHKLEAVSYRLEKDIGYAYSDVSALIDNYLEAAILYDSYEKVESLIKDRSELVYKRNAEKNYYIYKYRIENRIYSDDTSTSQCF